jgi:uncharacterized protein YjbJ (UPF0337 family)
MKLSTRYQARGLFRIISGTTRAMAGRICSNRTMGVKGKVECLAGRLQLKVGKVQGLCGL